MSSMHEHNGVLQTSLHGKGLMIQLPCLPVHERRLASKAAPGAPAHALQYMHALEIMQRYSQALAAAAHLLRSTRWDLGLLPVPWLPSFCVLRIRCTPM